METETEQEGYITVIKLPPVPTKPNTHNYSLSSPLHSSIAVSIPFSWEEEPGKPKQHSSFSSPSPITSYSSFSPETHKSLELPPRLLSLEKDGGSYTKLNSLITVFDESFTMTRSKRMDSPSFRMMLKGNIGCDMSNIEDEVVEESKKKRGRLGFFGFRRRRALKGKTEFGKGSYVFPSSVDRESEDCRKDEEEDGGEGKIFGYGDCDGIGCSQSSRFDEVKIANISRSGSCSSMSAPPSFSSSNCHFWTDVYAGLKQMVPWKNKKTAV